MNSILESTESNINSNDITALEKQLIAETETLKKLSKANDPSALDQLMVIFTLLVKCMKEGIFLLKEGPGSGPAILWMTYFEKVGIKYEQTLLPFLQFYFPEFDIYATVDSESYCSGKRYLLNVLISSFNIKVIDLNGIPDYCSYNMHLPQNEKNKSDDNINIVDINIVDNDKGGILAGQNLNGKESYEAAGLGKAVEAIEQHISEAIIVLLIANFGLGIDLKKAIAERDLHSIQKLFDGLIDIYENLPNSGHEAINERKKLRKTMYLCFLKCSSAGLHSSLPEELHERLDKLFPYRKLEAQWSLYFDELGIRHVRFYPDETASYLLPDLSLAAVIGPKTKNAALNDFVTNKVNRDEPIVILDGPPDYREYGIYNCGRLTSSLNMIPKHYEVIKPLRCKADFEAEGLDKVIQAIEQLG